MRERERLSLRTYREELETTERAEREARERPIREAEQKLKATHGELIKIQRENVAKLKDPEVFVSPELANASMSQEDADKLNSAQVSIFIQETPEYLPYRTQENADMILDYLSRNGIQIADAQMFRAAFYRLRDIGLLTARETPEPEPTREQRPTAPNVAREIDNGESTNPETYEGWDLQSGEPRTYTKREVNAMSSHEYRRVFRIYKEHLALPIMGPGARR